MKKIIPNKLSIALLGAFSLAFAFSSSAERSPRLPGLSWAAFQTCRDGRSPPIVRGPTHEVSPAALLAQWNQIAVDASGLDHTPVPLGDPRIFGEQVGPGRSSRAMAIVHIAMFDAVNGVLGGYDSFTNITPAPNASIAAAIVQAAHDTLVAVFPSQKATFDQALAIDLSEIPDDSAKTAGIDLGQRAAAAILALTANDGSAHAEPRLGVDFFPSNAAGKWRQDPISQIPVALGAFWSQVTPFVMQSATQFRAPAPPAMNSPEYRAAYNEVKFLGGDGIATPTSRTDDQTEAGIYWAYDGTPSLCAPPRLYNQITMKIAQQKGTASNPLELARLLALVNVSMSDAGIAIWESKFFYQVWRPVTGIRESDVERDRPVTATGMPSPLAIRTSNRLGAPASNLTGPNFTPPFPGLSVRPRRLRRRALPDASALLSHRRHRVHVHVRRIRRQDDR